MFTILQIIKQLLTCVDFILFVVSLLEENTNDDDITQGEQNDRPSHARKPINLGDGC
jgi:hypothetical protein